jgi:hypothetical protein
MSIVGIILQLNPSFFIKSTCNPFLKEILLTNPKRFKMKPRPIRRQRVCSHHSENIVHRIADQQFWMHVDVIL